MYRGCSNDYFAGFDLEWHLIVVLVGLEIRYGNLDALLVSTEPDEADRSAAETIRSLQQLVPKLGSTVGNLDRLLPRLLVAIGREPAGRNCAAFAPFRHELIRLMQQPIVRVPDWQRLARNVPLSAKLNIAATADRVAKKFPFLLQEYQLQRQMLLNG